LEIPGADVHGGDAYGGAVSAVGSDVIVSDSLLAGNRGEGGETGPTGNNIASAGGVRGGAWQQAAGRDLRGKLSAGVGYVLCAGALALGILTLITLSVPWAFILRNRTE
jgi:hypothetical protein